MPAGHPLGDYLRARRAILQPADVGLDAGPGHRRVDGLRRSEVAQIAGISTEYYVKLEQGQETRPTDQVVDALSRALRLDVNATIYLHALARMGPSPAAALPTTAVERTRWLIDSWPMTPALILDRHFDIVAINHVMSRLIESYRVGLNVTVVLLTRPAMQQLYTEWEALSARTIGLFRARVGLYPDDPRTQELIDEMTRDSARFRDLWNRHDIAGMSEGAHAMRHPVEGVLTLHYQHLPLIGSDDHTIFVYYAEPGSPSEATLARIAALDEGGSPATSQDAGTRDPE
ncbi:helix-turn-helix domain-containing protein [Microbacterium sp. SLBN-111]|uniref:helix-turn-helix domain-containing protein n=1 Tax=Microbacterium sp. SLBN-111 TaxID=3377733 RepID=UPI003C78CB8C